MMCQKRNEKISIEKELSLIDVENFETITPNAEKEIARFYILWDAVGPSIIMLTIVCFGR
jgi:hypothetical protein